jgi:putative acetyltransferase
MENITIRTIEEKDNQTIAALIREVLASFNANKEGTAFADPGLDQLYEIFQVPSVKYWVAESDGQVIGGGGVYLTKGLPRGYCELVKLYLAKDARGKGIGLRILNTCFSFAAEAGFTHIYLETLSELHMAIPVYEKAGFTRLGHPLGNTGHFACNIWMVRPL